MEVVNHVRFAPADRTEVVEGRRSVLASRWKVVNHVRFAPADRTEVVGGCRSVLADRWKVVNHVRFAPADRTEVVEGFRSAHRQVCKGASARPQANTSSASAESSDAGCRDRPKLAARRRFDFLSFIQMTTAESAWPPSASTT